MKTTLALIGTGLVGERIINQALANDDYEIVALYDENRERLNSMAKKYNLRAMESLDALLSTRADWVYIGTPPASHAVLTEKIAEAGLHVLSEKPLAHDVAEGQKMVVAVEDANVQSAMHFPMMYSSEVRTLKQALDNGDLGEVKRIELHVYLPQWPRPWQQNPWIATREQGGFIREIFPHYLQLTNHLFDGLEIIAHQTEYPEDLTLSEISVAAIAQTAEGIPMIINGLTNVAQQERIDFKVFGTKKVMTIRNWGQLWESTADSEEKQIEVDLKTENLLQACRQHLNGEEALVIPFEEGLKVQWWIEELLK